MPDYAIIDVRDRRGLNKFIKFPDKLYRSCPQYVPALHSDQINSLTKVSTLSYCTRRMWMAVEKESGKIVGRICAMVNPRYNERYGTKRARFGWFDSINDKGVSCLLFRTAEKWAKEQGMNEIHGPLYYNTLGKQGMLVAGFENIPPFNCLYNYPYYNTLVEDYGFTKECDWVQYKLPVNGNLPEKMLRLAGIIKERYGLKVASIDKLKRDKEQIRKFFKVYNDSFAGNVYNFIPMTSEEIDEEAKASIPFVSDKASCMIMDKDDNIIAFGVSFPSISKALQKAKGRLFPFGWIHLLKALNNYETTDLMINGAAPDWQNKGISAVYYKEMSDKAAAIGNKFAITNPQIESNSAVNLWNSYDHELYMRRRCYVKPIE